MIVVNKINIIGNIQVYFNIDTVLLGSRYTHLIHFHRWDKKSPYRKPPIGVHNPYRVPSYRDYGPYRKRFFPIGIPYRKFFLQGSICPIGTFFVPPMLHINLPHNLLCIIAIIIYFTNCNDTATLHTHWSMIVSASPNLQAHSNIGGIELSSPQDEFCCSFPQNLIQYHLLLFYDVRLLQICGLLTTC